MKDAKKMARGLMGICYRFLEEELGDEEKFFLELSAELGGDSTASTLAHIKRVSDLLSSFSNELLRRGSVHDASKLRSPEKEFLDGIDFSSDVTYMSEEYKALLSGELAEYKKHHYAFNSHHPEHYAEGIEGMNLFDIVEMLMDWKAAGERHKDGNIYDSIRSGVDRFSIGPQLRKILDNTALHMYSEGMW